MRINTVTIAHFENRTFSNGLLNTMAKMVGGWLERSRQRHQLAGFDERMLRDIGIHRHDVVTETTKPFWRL